MSEMKQVVVRPIFAVELRVPSDDEPGVVAQDAADAVADALLRLGHRFSVGDYEFRWTGEVLETVVDGEEFETDVED
jgi:hypothetical protein